MKSVVYALLIPFLLVSIDCFAQSNKGTEFWTAYMAHNNGTGGARGSSMVLYITSDVSTTGSVEIGGSLLQNFSVAANAVTFIPIPAVAYMSGAGKYLSNGIHITAQAPIAVYAHIYANNVSGATLLLPVNTLGKDYMSLNYKQLSNAQPANPAYSTFDVIATEDNTTVAITPSAPMLTGEAANAEYTVTLNKGEVYQGLSTTDLTGTKIKSISTNAGTCKRIAVFSGSTRIGIGCLNSGIDFSSDNLFQQVYPTSTWGKNYVTAPLRSRPYDLYRIVLSDATTSVKLNGNILAAGSFVNGLYYEFTSTTTNVISADKPVQVIQYSPTQDQNLNCTTSSGDVGDPEMIYLSPVEQGLDHVTLYSTGYYAILQSYVNVVIPTSGVASFTIDGKPYTGFSVIPGSAYSYAQIAVTSGPQAGNNATDVTSGTHNIKAAVPFNAVAYGFGRTESYGYAAGTNLQDLNEFVALQDPENPTNTKAAGCSNITYKLEVTIPYQTNSIVWKIDGVTVYNDKAPVVRSTSIKDNKTLYVYEYNAQLNFKVGAHDVIATVFDPVADECGSYKDIENIINITDPATADFSVANTCFGSATTFTDKTVLGLGSTVKTWLWDFGDGTTSTDRAPTHTYTTAGEKIVHLTVTDNVGCTSTSAEQKIRITTVPVAGFTISNPDCTGQDITFKDTSKPGEGTITTWLWDFGDGTKTTLQNGDPLTHAYAATGPYTVTLTVTNANGCTSAVYSQAINVTPLPVVDFVLPDACIFDVNSQFRSTSTIADNTEDGFTYLWDFGDGTPGHPGTSTLKDPQHTFKAAKDYTISLTVTSKYGCVTTLSKPFTVNGSDPRTAFNIQNKDHLCSADSVAFVDASTPDFGSVTKLVWYFDHDNHPNEGVTIEKADLRSDKTYHHFYGLNNTSAPITYHVVLVAYTGETCQQISQPQAVVINPEPQVTLTANNAALVSPLVLCEGDGPATIKGSANLTGTETFSGTGITSSGTFDPQGSGPGTFTINYLFIAAGSGCAYATSFQVVVNPSAKVTLPSTYTVLEGGELTLNPVTSVPEGNLTYKWTPSAGLSRDDVANPIVTVTEDTQYTLTVTSDKGCPTIVQTTVNVLKLPQIPNAFTPNGDGINDTWEIKYLDQYPKATVQIFNRYGAKVYFSNGYSKAWDGRFDGADLPMGTYYYIISPNSGRKPISGYLTIIR